MLVKQIRELLDLADDDAEVFFQNQDYQYPASFSLDRKIAIHHQLESDAQGGVPIHFNLVVFQLRATTVSEDGLLQGRLTHKME